MPIRCAGFPRNGTIRGVPLEFDEARAIVIEMVRALPPSRQVEALALDRAHGRILAKAVVADRDYPTLERSLRDGFAVKSRGLPGTLTVAGEVRAGDQALAPLADG